MFDKNFITVFGDASNMLKNISDILSGCLLRTRKNISSKNILNNALNKDQQSKEEDNYIKNNEMDLLYDILEENNSEINLVRYTTSEIDSLFKDLNYLLIRKKIIYLYLKIKNNL